MKDEKMNKQLDIFSDNPEYDVFVEKFKPKKTTDDCYTPPLVYEAIAEWACEEYSIDPDGIVRPFYPGGDYEHYNYPDGCTVLDNPPFSILSKICEFYLERGVRFFLFAPSLTVFSGRSVCMKMTHIVPDLDITYENGAVVKTAFVTNLNGDVIARTAPDLKNVAEAAMKQVLAKEKRSIPKYSYPGCVLTAAMLQKISSHGVRFEVRRRDCIYISKLDAQKEKKKTIFGGGLLLAEKAAAEKAAAEKAAAIVWELSAREREIQARLG